MIIEKANSKKPSIEPVTFVVDDVSINVYGIIHGVLGGSSTEYVNEINTAISNAPGAKYCEKSMKKMYKGLEYDVADWMVFRFVDAFKFSFSSFSNPRFVYHYFSAIIRELSSSKSDYGEDDLHSLSDLSSSIYFHNLDHYERREIRGLPSPDEYLKLNIKRWESGSKKSFRFSNKDMAWLEFIEPNACIPLRSIHMLEYVLSHAKKNGFKEVSFFCGDIHSSDMHWYAANARNDDSHYSTKYSNEIKENIDKALSSKLFFNKMKFLYYSSLITGALSTVALYLLVFKALT